MEYANLKSEPQLKFKEHSKCPPHDWPQKGTIVFKSVKLRYVEGGKLVLNDLNLSIYAKEKIGIVGRTGAGKSSIAQVLFRLVDFQGIVEIDGVDTQTVELYDLRRKISIIPQDPVLFAGTMRSNLDPFGNKSDDILWQALKSVQLKEMINKLLVAGLESKISDGGANFSMGQRQLICLARALLCENRILVLDEATANVDPETDQLIQSTIRTRFANCTVLTIAHRLNTVMDCDRILVMDASQCVKFGSPEELLAKEGGIFKSLVEQAGV